MTHAVHLLYPVLLVAVDIGLAGVLYLFVPAIGVLMATVGLLVALALVGRAVNQLGPNIRGRLMVRL